MLTSRVRSSVGAEFLEAIVKLAFARSNPEFGEVGKADASAVPEPLPGCLETMLKNHLLLNAKRDALADVMRKMASDGPTKAVLANRRDALRMRFEKLSKSDAKAAAAKASGKGPLVSMERWCEEMFELGLTRDVVVTPTSPIKGKSLPEMKTSLSLIDCKGSFVSGQDMQKKSTSGTITADEVPTTAIRTRTMAAQSPMAAPTRETAALVRVRRGV
jgi:hypothetical protein